MSHAPSAGNHAIFILADVVAACDGALARGGKLAPITGVTTDSRAIGKGNLFVALSGDRFDGHAFVAQVAAAGAAGAVVRRGFVPPAELPAGFGLVEVDDPLRALGALAKTHRRRFPNLPLVAVTGSNGKTTTKELAAAAMTGAFGVTLRTEGNLNNEIGLPLTLLRLDGSHQAAVVELGMNHAGEIDRLTRFAEPKAGLVTCAQPVHLEGLGSVEAVAKAKGELFFALPRGAIAVPNLDDALVAAEAKASGRALFGYGVAADAAVRLTRIVSHDRHGLSLEVSVRGGEPAFLRVPLVGRHNALNACGALALTLAAGGALDAALSGLSQAQGFPRRLQLRPARDGFTVLDDCYNANPPSMIAAVRTLRELAGAAPAIAVLGDMRELGAYEEAGHREAGAAAAAAELHALVAFGPRARALADAARAAGLPEGRVLTTEDPAEALAFVRARASKEALVLVKASRGTQLERVADPLVEGGG